MLKSKKIEKRRSIITAVILMLGIILLFFFVVVSITNGAADIPIATVLEAFTKFNPKDTNHLMIVDLRLPRTLGAVLVGAALAVAGALMQGMTRNPLADTGIMGINSGAGLAVAICFAFLQGISYGNIVLASFMGAALSATLVFTISKLVPGGGEQMKLVLAGATVSIMLSALSQAIAISNNITLNINFWTMGSVAGTSWKQLSVAFPLILAAIVGGVVISRGVSALAMGEEVAKGLGVSIERIKFLGTLFVVLLAGTSVAVAGNVSFIGMMIPHFTRFLVGSDYRKIIPVCAVLGALLLVMADLFSKTFIAPAELPVGTVIALLGVPVFLYFARKQKTN